MIRQEDIYLKNTIVHILDSTVGMPVLSDTELEHGSDFADFIKAHIAKITSGDDLKSCSFSATGSSLSNKTLAFCAWINSRR